MQNRALRLALDLPMLLRIPPILGSRLGHILAILRFSWCSTVSSSQITEQYIQTSWHLLPNLYILIIHDHLPPHVVPQASALSWKERKKRQLLRLYSRVQKNTTYETHSILFKKKPSPQHTKPLKSKRRNHRNDEFLQPYPVIAHADDALLDMAKAVISLDEHSSQTNTSSAPKSCYQPVCYRLVRYFLVKQRTAK